MRIQAKNDVSYLFSGLSAGASNAAGSNFLGQYASIKNGSYAKLLKAYYSESGNSSLKGPVKDSQKGSVTSEEAKALTQVQSATDSLKDSADALLSKSMFAMKDIKSKDENGVETTTKGYDKDAIYDAVNALVKDYNSVIDAANKVDSKSVLDKATSMVNATISNVKLLNKIGITINEDSTLSIDKETFKDANMNTVKSLFNGSGSYAYRLSAQSSMINFAADRAASKAATYTTSGTYNNTYNTGLMFNTYF